MLVKICGVTSYDDARMCLSAGADWIGLNLVGGPRQIDQAAALAIARQLGASPPVAVLVKARDLLHAPAQAEALLLAGCTRLQAYGELDAAQVASLRAAGFSLIHVLSASAESCPSELPLAAAFQGQPDFVLFDAAVPGKLGGTGITADWQVVRRLTQSIRAAGGPKVMLAGGLRPENVAQAIAAVRPEGVDVSSGVEQTPGRKDPDLVRRFVEAARRG